MPRLRPRLGTRELVIAFAIVEAVVLLWLVTRTTRERSERRERARMQADSAAIHRRQERP